MQAIEKGFGRHGAENIMHNRVTVGSADASLTWWSRLEAN